MFSELSSRVGLRTEREREQERERGSCKGEGGSVEGGSVSEEFTNEKRRFFS